MLTVLLVCPKITQFELFKDCLVKSENVNMLEAETVDFGLKIAKETNLDLVIVAEHLDVMSGLEFVNTIVKANPFINSALVSSLSSDDFHEETEGLGVLMQLPLEPQKTDAEELLQKMEKITSLMSLSRNNEVKA